jgi:hypothetical protein
VSPALFVFRLLFSARSCCLSGTSLGPQSSYFCMTGRCHCTQLINWDGVLLTFSPGWPLTAVFWSLPLKYLLLQTWTTTPGPQFSSFTYGYPISSMLFVKMTIISLLCSICTLVEDQLNTSAWFYFWALCSFGLHNNLSLWQFHTVLMNVAL